MVGPGRQGLASREDSAGGNASGRGRRLVSQPAICREALKGFLTWHDIAFRQVHELGEIGRQCLHADPTLSDLLQRANSLTKYAVRFRYPGAPYEPAFEKARGAHALAREVLEAIMARLREKVRPQEAG